MKIRGEMIDLLLAIDQEAYKPHITYENGKRVLYVHIRKAIYGMLQSALLFYKKFRKSIERYGFKINPYDSCVANKMVQGKQMTISWHVDDVKVSHLSPNVVDSFIDWSKAEYGKEREVTVTRGKKHVYLGMLLDYSNKGKAIIDMIEYIKDMCEEFPQHLSGKATSPASPGLFDVKPSKKLDKEKAETFHTFVAKSLFLTKRARDTKKITASGDQNCTFICQCKHSSRNCYSIQLNRLTWKHYKI